MFIIFDNEITKTVDLTFNYNDCEIELTVNNDKFKQVIADNNTDKFKIKYFEKTYIIYSAYYDDMFNEWKLNLKECGKNDSSS